MSSNPQSLGSQRHPSEKPQPDFSLMRVLSTVLVLAAIGGAGYAAFQLLDGGGNRLVKARGQVLWKGEPVTVGAILTEHLDDRTQAALGPLDKEGRFELSTHGEEGALPGKHKLAVAAFVPVGAASAPVVPAHYTSINSTPLVVTISKDPTENDLKIVLEGDMPERPRRPPADEEAEAESMPAEEAPADADQPGDAPQSETPVAGEQPAPTNDAAPETEQSPAATDAPPAATHEESQPEPPSGDEPSPPADVPSAASEEAPAETPAEAPAETPNEPTP